MINFSFMTGMSLVSIGGVSESGAQVARNREMSREGFMDETRSLLLEKCKSLSDEYVGGLLEAWKNLVNRVYYFHRIACRSYFTFLNLSAEVKDVFVGNVCCRWSRKWTKWRGCSISFLKWLVVYGYDYFLWK